MQSQQSILSLDFSNPSKVNTIQLDEPCHHIVKALRHNIHIDGSEMILELYATDGIMVKSRIRVHIIAGVDFSKEGPFDNIIDDWLYLSIIPPDALKHDAEGESIMLELAIEEANKTMSEVVEIVSVLKIFIYPGKVECNELHEYTMSLTISETSYYKHYSDVTYDARKSIKLMIVFCFRQFKRVLPAIHMSRLVRINDYIEALVDPFNPDVIYLNDGRRFMNLISQRSMLDHNLTSEHSGSYFKRLCQADAIDVGMRKLSPLTMMPDHIILMLVATASKADLISLDELADVIQREIVIEAL